MSLHRSSIARRSRGPAALVAALLLRDARRVPAGRVRRAVRAWRGRPTRSSPPRSFAPVPPLWLLPLRIARHRQSGGVLAVCRQRCSTTISSRHGGMARRGCSWCVWPRAACASARRRRAGSASRLGSPATRIGVWYVLAGRALDLVEAAPAAASRAGGRAGRGLFGGDHRCPRSRCRPAAAGRSLHLANGIGLLAITLVFAVVLLSVSRDSALISLPVVRPAGSG